MEIALARREEELALRVQKRPEARTGRLSGSTVDAIKRSLHETQRLRAVLPEDAALADIVAGVTSEVDTIIPNDEALARFHGRDILNKFHQRFVNSLGVGLTAFELEVACTVGRSTLYRTPSHV